MADLNIRKDFLEGTYEIFNTLFSDGISDGINLYLMSEETTTSIYRESKYKVYKKPVKLVSYVRVEPQMNRENIEEQKYLSTFIVPLKALQDNNISVDKKGLIELKKGVIEFHGSYYTIESVMPKGYIEDIFLFYHLMCIEDKCVTNLKVEESHE